MWQAYVVLYLTPLPERAPRGAPYGDFPLPMPALLPVPDIRTPAPFLAALLMSRSALPRHRIFRGVFWKSSESRIFLSRYRWYESVKQSGELQNITSVGGAVDVWML